MFKKKYFVTLALITASFVLEAQQPEEFYKWDVSVSYALQEHDKRMYDYPQIPKQRLLDKHPENWGTHWYGLTIHRNVLESSNFKLKAGLGYFTEYRTFQRPYNGCLWYDYDGFCPDVGAVTDGYKIKMISLPIDYTYYLIGGVGVNLAAQGNFSFFKNPISKRSSFGRGFYKLSLYSISLFPGVSYEQKRFNIKLDYRLFQLKNIDDIIIYHGLFTHGNTPDPRENGKYETYNPAHFRLTLSYEFGKREFEEER